MCVDALKIIGTTAGTDFGSSKQRDLGQQWADMTRGYLGEYALKLFLKEKYNIEVELGHEQGVLADYLSSDIKQITDKEGTRPPHINIGVKSIKWNGLWFDIPNDQFHHSHYHVLVKVGAGRDHLLAFFKKISVFKDKILPVGQKVGAISSEESLQIYDHLPTFSPIPAYIVGFVKTDSISKDEYKYAGTKGRLNYSINSWIGKYKLSNLLEIKGKEKVTGKVEFAGIKKFSHDNSYLFNTGALEWSQAGWGELVKAL